MTLTTRGLFQSRSPFPYGGWQGRLPPQGKQPNCLLILQCLVSHAAFAPLEKDQWKLLLNLAAMASYLPHTSINAHRKRETKQRESTAQ